MLQQVTKVIRTTVIAALAHHGIGLAHSRGYCSKVPRSPARRAETDRAGRPDGAVPVSATRPGTAPGRPSHGECPTGGQWSPPATSPHGSSAGPSLRVLRGCSRPSPPRPGHPALLTGSAPARGVALVSLAHRGAGARTPDGQRPSTRARRNRSADPQGQAREQARAGAVPRHATRGAVKHRGVGRVNPDASLSAAGCGSDAGGGRGSCDLGGCVDSAPRPPDRRSAGRPGRRRGRSNDCRGRNGDKSPPGDRSGPS